MTLSRRTYREHDTGRIVTVFVWWRGGGLNTYYVFRWPRWLERLRKVLLGVRK